MWRLLNSLLLLLLLLAVGQEGRIARLAPPAAAIPTSSRSVAAVNATADNSSAVAAVNLTSSTAVNNATTVPAAYDAAAQSNPLDNLVSNKKITFNIPNIFVTLCTLRILLYAVEGCVEAEPAHGETPSASQTVNPRFKSLPIVLSMLRSRLE